MPHTKRLAQRSSVREIGSSCRKATDTLSWSELLMATPFALAGGATAVPARRWILDGRVGFAGGSPLGSQGGCLSRRIWEAVTMRFNQLGRLVLFILAVA